MLTDTSQLGEFYNLCINTHTRAIDMRKKTSKKEFPEQNESEKNVSVKLINAS